MRGVNERSEREDHHGPKKTPADLCTKADPFERKTLPKQAQPASHRAWCALRHSGEGASDDSAGQGMAGHGRAGQGRAKHSRDVCIMTYSIAV